MSSHMWWIVGTVTFIVALYLWASAPARAKAFGTTESFLKKQKENGITLLFSAIGLIMLNLLLKHLMPQAWGYLRIHSGFWTIMIGILIAIVGSRIAPAGAGKIFSKLILAGSLLSAAVILVKGSVAPQRVLVTSSSQLSGQPEEFIVKKGEWSPKLSPKAYQADPVAGRKIRLDGEPEKILSWRAGSSIFVPAYATYIQISSSEENLNVTGIRVE